MADNISTTTIDVAENRKDASKSPLLFDHIVLNESNEEFRIIHISPSDDYVYAIRMNTDAFDIRFFGYAELTVLIASGSASKLEDAIVKCDIDALGDVELKEFQDRCVIVKEITEIYGPTFVDLATYGSKPVLKRLAEEYGLKERTVKRIMLGYLQGGCLQSTLLRKNSPAFGRKKRDRYTYNSKTGRPDQDGLAIGVPLTEEIYKAFEIGLEFYLNSKHITIRDAYDYMNMVCFSRKNDDPLLDRRNVLLPMSQRPTFRQFTYYISHQRKEDLDRKRIGRREQTNSKRVLLSDSQYRVYGSGDCVEIDACEIDLSLVSENSPDVCVGRPILYAMIDVFSKLILAVHVGFDNNSYIGLSALFANLIDDKKQILEKYGLASDLINNNFVIPRSIRTDRGSDFLSKGFRQFMKQTKTRHEIAPPAMGSYKGNIEQFFHRVHADQAAAVYDAGHITLDHDSNHHKKAVMNINDYTKLLLAEVAYHNEHYMDSYPLTKEMTTQGIKPIPKELWEFGLTIGGGIRQVYTDAQRKEYFASLLVPGKASVTRSGISFSGLTYVNTTDASLLNDIYNHKPKTYYEIRYDPRIIDTILYKSMEDDTFRTAKLNTMKNDMKDLPGLSFAEYELIRIQRRSDSKDGRNLNDNLRVANLGFKTAIVKDARKRKPSVQNKTDQLRESREVEKRTRSKQDTIMDRVTDNDASDAIDTTKQEITTNTTNSEYGQFSLEFDID